MNNRAAGIEADYQQRTSTISSGQFLKNTNIELIHPVKSTHFKHALFDFDGTISLLRAGWPDVMQQLMEQVLLEAPVCEPHDMLSENISQLIQRTTGKQTIYQMIELCAEVKKRGGVPLTPSIYKQQYLDMLMAQIGSRIEGVRSGKTAPTDMLVDGAVELLEALQQRGVCMYLASGTDQEYVKDEANILGIAHYFGSHIYGAIEDYQNYSKALVIERVFADSGASGSELLGFGDGYVEIDNTKSVGGTAIGVASDEIHRSGKPDTVKRNRLIGVGADVIVPDFHDSKALVSYLFGETK